MREPRFPPPPPRRYRPDPVPLRVMVFIALGLVALVVLALSEVWGTDVPSEAAAETPAMPLVLQPDCKVTVYEHDDGRVVWVISCEDRERRRRAAGGVAL